MSIEVMILKGINHLFPPVVHPFNLQKTSGITYAEWQYQKGEDTVRYFLPFHSLQTMFCNKTVLDIGCGAAGKTIYYASQGVKRITGLEILGKYREEAELLSKKYHQEAVFSYVVGDAAQTPFLPNTFDTIIMNDAMEHVSDPDAVLAESYRILKPGGFLYINFPPYYHPFGAHLSDVISIPWVHAFFRESTLIQAYQQLLEGHEDGKERISFRFSEDSNGVMHISYINRMTIRKFLEYINNSSFQIKYYYEDPLRRIFTGVREWSICREWLTKMVVCILEKPAVFPTEATKL